MRHVFYISFIALLLIGCSKDEDAGSPDFKDGTQYQVTFSINWNSTDFPTDYPSGAHFSKLIGWSHDSTHTFFKVGTMASLGIKNMAETGSTSPLDAEFSDMIEDNKGFNYFIGDNLGTGVGDINIKVEVTKEFPSITLATMVAPSPDWYIAVVNVNLLENNALVNQKTVEAHVYDAGTDSGDTYTSPDEVTNPQEPITLFVDSPLGNGQELNASIGTITFTKL